MLARPLALACLTAAVLILSAAGCGQKGTAAPAPPPASSSPQPASRARITIITPVNGQVIRAPTVQVKVRITLTSPAPATPQALPGWLHLYLDGKIMTIQPVPGNYGVMETPLGHLGPGRHLLRAEFVQPSHLPWRPAVADTVTFTMRKP